MPHLLSCLLAASLAIAGTPLVLQISSETAPPGGWAQIKITAGAPTLIAGGDLTLDFDSSIFGPIANLAVFSATGDQIGYANVKGEHVDVHFSSASAGIGQLPNLPVFTVSVPVLATATPGMTSSITADPSSLNGGTKWTDQNTNQYSVTVLPGTFTVGGTLSIQAITPGGGLLPSGTVLQVTGTGFDPSTSVAIDGVSITHVDFVSTTVLKLTLGGATEMTGKHVRVTNAAGARVDYFAALPSASADPGPGFPVITNLQPILPFTTYTNSQTFNPVVSFSGYAGFAMLNPNLAPATVTFEAFSRPAGVSPTELLYVDTLVIPPGELYYFDATTLLQPLDLEGELFITASTPIRFVEVIVPSLAYPMVTRPSPATSPAPPVQVSLPASRNSVSWTWQTGTAPPAPATVTLSGSFAFTTSVSAPVPNGGGQWLSVSATSNGSSSTLTLTPDPSKLSAGSYSGAVTVTPIAPASLSAAPVVPTTINVSLIVTTLPQISYTSQGCCVFFAIGPGRPGGLPENLTVSTNGNPAQVAVSTSSNTGGDWLMVSPSSGTTPLQLTVTANPATLNLAPGDYAGQITIQGPGNSVVVPVGLHVFAPPTHGTTLQINGPPPNYTLPAGSPQQMAAAGFITFQEFDVALTSVTTNVPWLTATILANTVELYPNSVGLSPGFYSGTITIDSSNYPELQVPATLTVIAAPTAQTILTANPTSLSFTAPVGGSSPPQTLAIGFNGGPVLFNLRGGAQWLQAPNASNSTTAAPAYNVSVYTSGLAPGAYHTALTVSWTTGSITIPVTLSVTPTATFPPIMSAIVNSASGIAGAIAPGEILSIFGSGVGGTPTGPQLDSSGKVLTTLAQTQVLIGGIAAPLIYVSASQVNAIVPFGGAIDATTTVQVVSNGIESATWQVPLAVSAPAIFTGNSTGKGQAAALNQDNSVNGLSNPAARGTVIQLYATGGGLTHPPGTTGTLASSGENLAQSVSVTIAGVNAPVQFAGSAPGEVEGLVQINALIPQTLGPSLTAPVAVTIGNAPSQAQATIAIN
ncbi:MAG: hypothetical protein JO062_22955 [Bryobacterales bacterium]|nr:hypothetical protein [Bryobacterales bacterium]